MALSLVAFLTPQHNRSAWAASYLEEVCLWWRSVALYTDGPRTGYTFQTNQHGLSLDTVVGFNLVLPNGTIAYVTELTHPDLFFGLKGGFNNFVSRSTNTPSLGSTERVQGIVTDFTMNTFPQTEVWVRTVTFSGPTTHI